MRAALAAVVFFSPAIASAFECTPNPGGPTIAWVTRCIPYSVQDGDPRFDEPSELAEIEAAFAMWSDPTCTDLRFFFTGYAKAPGDGIHVQSGDTEIDAGVAISNITFQVATGEALRARIILDTDAEIGVVDDTCVGTYALRNVVAHELGHTLGFDDDPAGQSILTTQHAVCTPPWDAIGSNDLTGVCTVYASNTPVMTCSPPPGGYDKDDMRPTCETVGVGAPCSDDAECGNALACNLSTNRCELDLSSRGCVCTAREPHEAGPGWFLGGMALMLLVGWRRPNSR